MSGQAPAGLDMGAAAPLGASLAPGGVNFSVFSKRATRIELLLFDDRHAVSPSRIIALEPDEHRTYHYWHRLVPDIGPGQVYGYRAHGPFAPERGLRFDGEKLLLDPYGLAVAVPDTYDRAAAMIPFIVTVQIAVLPPMTGLGAHVNAATVGYTDVSVAVLFTPL